MKLQRSAPGAALARKQGEAPEWAARSEDPLVHTERSSSVPGVHLVETTWPHHRQKIQWTP